MSEAGTSFAELATVSTNVPPTMIRMDCCRKNYTYVCADKRRIRLLHELGWDAGAGG